MNMMKGRKTISVDRLLRRSTMQEHVTINELPIGTGEQKVELIKLRHSFQAFNSPDAESEQTTHKSSAANGISKAPAGHDILVTIPYAEMVEMQPTTSGWFAVLVIDKAAKVAVESFVSAGRRHFKETNMHGGYVSPFSQPLEGEEGHVRLSVKVSEFDGKLTHTTFSGKNGEVLHKAGDSVVGLHAKPLLGACSPTIHMAGYWYDQTKQGPLLYLTSVCAIDKGADKEILVDEPPIINELIKSPGGTQSRRTFTSPIKNDSPEMNLGDDMQSLLGDRFGEWTFGKINRVKNPILQAVKDGEKNDRRPPSPPLR